MGATVPWLRKGLVLCLLLSVSGVAAACSKKAPEPAAQQSAPASPAPEDVRAPAAEVAAGLRQIDQTAKGVADKTGTDPAGAQQLDAQIHPAWEKVEGTIKSNNPDAYIAFEDNMAMLSIAAKNGDAAKAKTAAESISKAVGDYLTAYPG
jgi:hypothetical protein